MNREDYTKFLELETLYETERSKITKSLQEIFKKLHFVSRKSNLSGRHHGSLDDELYFSENSINCYVSCCGDPAARFYTLVLDDLFNPKWHEELDAEVQLVKDLIDHHNKKIKEEEIQRLQKQLDDLK